MDVGRLIAFAAVKMEAIRSDAHHGWHVGRLNQIRQVGNTCKIRLASSSGKNRLLPVRQIKMQSGAKRFLLASILVAAVVSAFSAHFNRYYLGVVIDIGINVILAVSLNLINGHTGQL